MNVSAFGYILHTKAFRETSVIVDAFTRSDGLVSVVFRGVRLAANTKSQRSRKANNLQPFLPLLLSWRGSHDLKNGHQFETNGKGFLFTGAVLYSALYLNELLLRLLFKGAPQPALFDNYQASLQRLQSLAEGDKAGLEIILREFELLLLAELGYELSSSVDSAFEPIKPHLWYLFTADVGFEPLLSTRLVSQTDAVPLDYFYGEQLLAISQRQWHSEALLAAKRLLRQALAPHLGGRPLKSRELFLPISI